MQNFFKNICYILKFIFSNTKYSAVFLVFVVVGSYEIVKFIKYFIIIIIMFFGIKHMSLYQVF